MNILNNLRHLLQKTYRLGGAIAAMTILSLITMQSASAAISSALDLGSTGSDVTQLQTFLAKDTALYPRGLVTGYFGALTQEAVQKFQVKYNIVSSGTPATTGYGRVGPVTRAQLNNLMGSDPGNQVSWDTSPVLSTPVIQATNTTATFTWSTNEPTQGQVYWDSAPLQFNEETGPRQQPYVSGHPALDAGGLSTNHTLMVSNLIPNTTYYYLVRSTDSGGNMSMIWPNTFRTTQ